METGRERRGIGLFKGEAQLKSGTKKAFRVLPDNSQRNARPKSSSALTSCLLAATDPSTEFILPEALSSPAAVAPSAPFARASVKSHHRGFSALNSAFYLRDDSYCGCLFSPELNHKPGFSGSVSSIRLLRA